MRGEFILDDDVYLTNSPIIKASDGLYRFWFTLNTLDYYPVSNSSLWLEWRLWGMNPTGYHVTNLVLHIASALLLWAILRKLATPGAFLAALLFAVHPVNVESVAWIAQRKNTMALLFFLLSIWWYLRNEQLRSTLTERGEVSLAELPFWNKIFRTSYRYWLSLLAFVLAMLSKGSVAILPVILLGMVWWCRRRITRRDLVRSLPFFFVAIGLTCLHIWCQTRGGEVVIREVGMVDRLVGAGAAPWFYLSKALLPINLLFIYPQWSIETSDWRWWLPLAAALRRRRFGWCGSRSTRAGKHMAIVLGSVGIFLCRARTGIGICRCGILEIFARGRPLSVHCNHWNRDAGCCELEHLAAEAAWGNGRTLATALATLFVGCLMLLTCHQSELYGNPIRLYEATLAKNPTCWMAHYNLGAAFVRSGQPTAAIEQFREAVQFNANYPEAHNNWGNALLALGEPEAAAAQFEEALRLRPDFPEAYYNLGNAQMRGKLRDAVDNYRRATKLDPQMLQCHTNLGLAYEQLGDLEASLGEFEKTYAQDDAVLRSHFNAANVLVKLNRPQEAVEQYRQALELELRFAAAHFNLANTLAGLGKTAEAIGEYRLAIDNDASYRDAQYNLANTLLQSGQPAEAVEHYLAVLRLDPQYAAADANLAVAYGQLGRGGSDDCGPAGNRNRAGQRRRSPGKKYCRLAGGLSRSRRSLMVNRPVLKKKSQSPSCVLLAFYRI